jgi:hypothetical protein
VRTTGARVKVMDCMDLFYKMEGKDMYVEKVFKTGSSVWLLPHIIRRGTTESR